MDGDSGSRLARRASSSACSSPAALSGMSVWPWIRVAVPVGLAVAYQQDLGHPITVPLRGQMPIVQVTALRQRVGVDIDAVSRALAVAVSRELGEEPSGTWVTWQTLPPGAYREGQDDAPLEQPARRTRRSCA